MVERDGGGEAEEALQDALSDRREGSCSVAFEAEDVLAGPEDALDALADRREVGAATGLVLALGPDDRGVHFTDLVGELSPGLGRGINRLGPVPLLVYLGLGDMDEASASSASHRRFSLRISSIRANAGR